MDTNLHTSYLFKAIDAYPYDLAETLESLNYALSYNENNAEALYLMGVVYAEQLHDYETAISYFEEAIAIKVELPKIYKSYINTLICTEEYEKAQKAIDFAKKLKGSDKAALLLYQGILYESQSKFKRAKKTYTAAVLSGLNNDFVRNAEEKLNRVKKKLKLTNPKKDPKKKQKKEKGKKKK